MKTKIFLSIVFTISCWISSSAQTAGGPDTYGYTWKNDAEPGGPVYTWNDIKTIGTQISTLGDDNQAGSFNLNWNFHYYWGNYNKVWVGSNGWLAFQNVGNIASPFPLIPTAGGANNFIAGMLSDLTFTTSTSTPVPGATAWYWTNNTDKFILQYDSVPFWDPAAPGYTGSNTFQIILDGSDSSITFHYKLQSGFTNLTPSGGLKTGIENLTGSIGLQVLNDAYPTSGTSVKFYYPNPVTYQVFDATPDWNQNSVNGGFFAAYGSSNTLWTDIASVGNQPISNITVVGKILRGAATVWTDTASVFSLQAGADSLLSFPSTFSPIIAGTHTYRTTTICTSDINPGNNITNVELVVPDASQTTTRLSFSAATTTTTGVAWQGGNGGVAVYYVPPFYPAVINSLDYFIPVTNAGGFIGQILDDDGPGGFGGTVLYMDSIAGTALSPAAYNTLTLATPVTITSGGFYVSWLMKGDTIQIGTDAALPLSNRNFEIIGGSWSPYRSNSTSDFMIRVNIQNNVFGVSDLNENSLTLAQNYPNPAANSTDVNFSLSKGGEVKFSVRNVIGQEVDAINLGYQSPGNHLIKINTSKFSSGIYFYTLKSGDKEVTKKMIISR